MQDLNNRIYRTISHIIENGIYPNLKIEDDVAYTIDPVYGIARNRVNAECVKTLIRINGMDGKDHTEIIEKLLNQLVKKQSPDGCWNEIHVKYDEPSALITSIVGEALLDGYVALRRKDLERTIQLAKDFVLANYTSPGYFKKSSVYVADHLNVDATCGAFIAKYGKVFSDEECIEIAKKTAEHICKYQFPDGAYPYTNENHGNYQYGLEIPCIHYQGVTIYYLLKIIDALESNWLDQELKKGIEWLASVQYNDGRFDWSKSGLMFAYYLSGAYAFAIPCFLYGNKWDSRYIQNSEKAMDVLENNIRDIANRWESASMKSLPSSLITSIRTANLGDYPIKHRAFRFGYGMYRQYARRRFADTVDPKLFNLLSSVMGIETSTIEPDNNFPDIFMTSEILDCLSYSLDHMVVD
ncbi:hypothetical protein SAMN04488587_0904 [Methanococcoides vulcani]|uniref:Squalene cyclase C-terminal domain-containing protein n=1 Tax=Methanococcoides vulcani TaxID=1353158 RepID=A0A1H9Z732_9EURY|nr:prenyltransferase/squalene oxidase repeat-containing protein [Methanococcoides vulcani]SES77287.1 hypothetical protein SAMN04488587_0904 [Methanococcoides vulcani]